MKGPAPSRVRSKALGGALWGGVGGKWRDKAKGERGGEAEEGGRGVGGGDEDRRWGREKGAHQVRHHVLEFTRAKFWPLLSTVP